MIIYVDIDETICINHRDRDYRKATPIKERISKINDLYDAGNTIIYWTARGTATGIDWEVATRKQLEDWGAKHDRLKMGKPLYDLFIDDRNINSADFFKDT